MRQLTEWDGEAASSLKAHWSVPFLVLLDSVSSTNDVALDLAARGMPAGTTVIANDQTSGRGQNGRRWHSHAGKSLLISMVLPSSAARREDLQEQAALATAAALRKMVAVAIIVKRPNDLLSARRRKIAGVLVERTASGRPVVGIGINVSQHETDWPTDIRVRADSLSALGFEIRRSALAGTLIAEHRRLWLPDGPAIETRAVGRRLSADKAAFHISGLNLRIDGRNHAGIWIGRAFGKTKSQPE
jgi:BirA family biotin operon repressor/biotin-[acetyl-CoA-carboxylase] ligase